MIKNPILISAFVVMAVVLLFFGLGMNVSPSKNSPVACTMEAKLCPDGTAVGRTGPNCEFAVCPAGNYQIETFIDKTQGISFEYPKDLLTTYIHPVDWPPKVAVMNEPFTCTEAGSEIQSVGKTEKQVINGNTYCVTKEAEGAAGSVYTQYAYATPKDGKVVILTFTIRTVQCDNYDDPQKTACKNEQGSFDVDSIANNIIETIQFAAPISEGSGISGTVLLGPTCPVMRNPPDPECADKPYSTKLELTTGTQSQIVKEFSSDANGKFSVEIPPGEYEIRSAASTNFYPRCATNSPIKVIQNTYTDTTVYCDTGIR